MKLVLDTFVEYVPTLLQLIGGILGIIAVQVVAKAKNWVVTKVGQTTYDRAVEVAKGLYVLLEDEMSDLKKAGEVKKREMERRLIEQFPTLTQTELDSINKIVWESFNQKYSQQGVLLGCIDSTTGSDSEEDLNE